MTRSFGDDTFGSGTFGGLSVVIPPLGITYTIEVDFTTPLLGVPSNWTDITEWVRNFTTRRGRSHELGRMQAGEASLRLDNRDRRFDPTYTSGPYYPNVVPMRHARIRVDTVSATYYLFRGFVEDWGQQWSGPHAQGQGDATCEVHLVDAFKVLNLIDLTPYQSEVLGDEPLAYWTMGDPSTSGSLENTGSDNSPLSVKVDDTAGLRTGTAAGPLPGGASVADYTGTTHAGWKTSALPTDYLLKDDITVEGWVYVPASFGGSSTLSTAILAQGGTARSVFYIDAARKPSAAILTEVGTLNAVSSSVAFTANAWHHVAWVRSGVAITFYVDGVAVDTKALRLAAWGTGDLTVATDFGGTGNGSGTRMAHLTVYPRALGSERIAAHYAARALGLIVRQSVDSAITVILDAIGWSGSLRSITASGHIVAAHLPDVNALTELLMLAEETDGGMLFLQGDGVLKFRSSDDLHADVTTSASWGDTTAELRYSGLTLRYDDEDLYTEVRATAEGLADAVSTDTTAAVTYGTRTLQASGGRLADQHQLNDRAAGYLTRYKAPAIRPDTLLAVDSVAQPARAEEMFASEIGRRVTITRRPPGGGTITLTSVVEGVSHTPLEALTQCRTTLNLVPVLDQTPWILGDATYGILDSTTDLGW